MMPDCLILTYKVLLEKFNGKYESLNDNQKTVLKEFINSVDSTPKLKTFYNTKIQEIKDELTKMTKKVTDKVVIERVEQTKTTTSGIILQRTEEPDRAKILAIGPEVEDVSVGDVVLL